MENKFHGLPPLKRFRLMEQQLQNQFSPPRLPAKKRKDSPANAASTTTNTDAATTYYLPAKKRVWAIQPFDLNVEYNPTIDDEEEEEEATEVKGNQGLTCDVQSIETGKSLEEEEVYADDEVGYATCIRQTEEAKKDENNQNLTGSIQCNENGKDGIECAPNTDEEKEAQKTQYMNCIMQSVEIRKGEDYDEDDDGIECAICHSTDGDPSDPIVFCDGCNLMVHATCYGNPLIKGIPTGDWFCYQCLADKQTSSSCCLCPIVGGALKSTKDGRWAHIVCALLVPEVFFTDSEGREEIDCSNVPLRRWREKCYICKSIDGCAIDCSEPKCPLNFHVGCGLKEDLCIEYREGRKTGAVVAGFCKSHTELWKKQQETGKYKIVAKEDNRK